MRSAGMKMDGRTRTQHWLLLLSHLQGTGCVIVRSQTTPKLQAMRRGVHTSSQILGMKTRVRVQGHHTN